MPGISGVVSFFSSKKAGRLCVNIKRHNVTAYNKANLNHFNSWRLLYILQWRIPIRRLGHYGGYRLLSSYSSLKPTPSSKELRAYYPALSNEATTEHRHKHHHNHHNQQQQQQQQDHQHHHHNHHHHQQQQQERRKYKWDLTRKSFIIRKIGI